MGRLKLIEMGQDAIILSYRAEVAKVLDSQSHFSKVEIVHELQLNTYLKGMQKMYLNVRNYIY